MINQNLLDISLLMVFMEGLLSFFSPCVLPLIPLYMGYLSSHHIENENRNKRQIRIFIFTLAFITGIFSAILLMNMSFSTLSVFFKKNQLLFNRIGGIIIIYLGLHQFGFIKIKFLEKNLHINLNLHKKKMSFLVAFAMGFTFSFAWTPCIGPALSSILILASTSASLLTSNFLALIYALGLTMPFLFLGIFTDAMLELLKKYRSIMNITVKIGAVLMIAIGLMLFTGKMNQFSNYLNNDPNQETTNEVAAIPFELNDLYGNTVTLEDYEGKVVMMNFWGTWCSACKMELPHLQMIYEKYKESDEVAILSFVNGAYQEQSAEGVLAFMDANGYDFPVLYDERGQVFYQYQIMSYPTTFMIDKEGNIFGYISGALTSDIMENIIDSTIKGEIPAN